MIRALCVESSFLILGCDCKILCISILFSSFGSMVIIRLRHGYTYFDYVLFSFGVASEIPLLIECSRKKGSEVNCHESVLPASYGDLTSFLLSDGYPCSKLLYGISASTQCSALTGVSLHVQGFPSLPYGSFSPSCVIY